MAIIKECACRRCSRHLRTLLTVIFLFALFCLFLINTYLTSEATEKYYIPAVIGVKNAFNRLISSNKSNIIIAKNTSKQIYQDFPFHYILNEPDFCSQRNNLKIINTVQVSVSDLSARTHIRQLWGSEEWHNETGMSTVFILGTTQDKHVMERVNMESNIHRDIIQVSFVDSYDNLTFKTLSSLHWTKTFCHNPKWFLKSDTDVFINAFRLSRYLNDYCAPSQFVCRVKPDSWRYPCRSNCKEPRWQISYEEFPGEKFPPHCQGPAYVIPRQLVGPLYEVSNKSQPFRMEDVYYTGLIVPKVSSNITWNDIAGKFPWRPTSWATSFTHSDLMVLEMEEGCGKGTWNHAWKEVLKMENILSNQDIQPEIKQTDYPVLMWVSVVIILFLILLIMTPCIESYIKNK